MYNKEEVVKFLKDIKKMDQGKDCNTCAFRSECNLDCYDFLINNPSKAIDLMEAWEEENKRTYKKDFLEKFPNATITVAGVPHVCRQYVYGGDFCGYKTNCVKCWNEEMPEEELVDEEKYEYKF